MERKKRGPFINPADVKKADVVRILDFMNTAKTAEEIVNAIGFWEDKEAGIRVAEAILKQRDKLGGFRDISQLNDPAPVDAQAFTEIVLSLGKKTIKKIIKAEHLPPDEYTPPVVYPFGATIDPGKMAYTGASCSTGTSPLSTPGEVEGFFWGGEPCTSPNVECEDGSSPQKGNDCEDGSTPSGGWDDCGDGSSPSGWNSDCEDGATPDRGYWNWCEDGSSPKGSCNDGSSP